MAAELRHDYDRLCTQYTYKAGIQNALKRFLERRKQSIQCILKYISKSINKKIIYIII